MEKSENLIVGKRYPEIDGLRAIAIIMVFLLHASQESIHISDKTGDVIAQIYHQFSFMGGMGVTLFFVISAFLITGILLDTVEQRGCLKKFYIRRCLRIFPLYYTSLLILTVGSAVLSHTSINEFSAIPYALYIQNWLPIFIGNFEIFDEGNFAYVSHFWSLAIEEQFYIFWPAICLFMLSRCSESKFIKIMIIAAISIIALRTGIVLITWKWKLAYIWTMTRIDAMILGALLAYIMKKKNQNALQKIQKLKNDYLGYILLTIILLCLFGDNMYYMFTLFLITLTTLISLFWVFSAAIEEEKGQWNKILRSKILYRIAEVSYGLYIIHWPVNLIIRDSLKGYSTNYWLNYILILGLSFTISFIIAWCSYRFFEKPIINLKHKYAPYN